jgi:hypothetical protein
MTQPFLKISGSISLTFVYWLSLLGPNCLAGQGLGPVATRVLHDFSDVNPSGFQLLLDRMRKPGLSAADRSRIRVGLPRTGELRPSVREAEKLAAVQPILRYHRREGIIEVKMVDVFQAAVALHARTFILMSQNALRQLDSGEVQALASHELGHDYFWDEYQSAVDSDDEESIQELELSCDALAIFTLADVGINPRKLISGLERLKDFNAHFGTLRNERFYPLTTSEFVLLRP